MCVYARYAGQIYSLGEALASTKTGLRSESLDLTDRPAVYELLLCVTLFDCSKSIKARQPNGGVS